LCDVTGHVATYPPHNELHKVEKYNTKALTTLYERKKLSKIM